MDRDISFERNDVMGIPQRVWDGLLNNRTLIYCMGHKINSKLLTPTRNHLLFPDVAENELQHVVLGRRSKTYGTLTGMEVEVNHLPKGMISSDNIISKSEKTLKGKVSKTNSRSSTTVPQNVTIYEREQLKKTFTIEKNKLRRKSDWSMSMQITKKIPAKGNAQNAPAGGSGTLRDVEMEKRISGFDPPADRVFTWRVLELKEHGISDEDAIAVADMEYQNERKAKRKTFALLKQVARIQGRSPPPNPYSNAIKEMQAEKMKFVRDRFYNPATREILQKLKQERAAEFQDRRVGFIGS